MGSYSCAHKVAYGTRTQARKAARLAALRYLHPMFWYDCEVCGQFHLSKYKRLRREYRIEAAGLVWYQ